MELKDEENFEEYKKSLIKFFEEKNYDKTFISYLKKAKSRENLVFELDAYIYKRIFGEDVLEDENEVLVYF